jgi:hypothetical protein
VALRPEIREVERGQLKPEELAQLRRWVNLIGDVLLE